MSRTVCRIVGVALLLAGLAGFVQPTLLGLHLTTIHDVVLLLTGLVSLYVGYAAGYEAARIYCLVLGALYLLLGALGLVAPGLVADLLGHAPVSARELAPDNAFHAVLGGALIVFGIATRATVVKSG